MIPWRSMSAIRFLAGSLLLLPAVPASADPYFNSSEPGCDGSDPNVLWCDDFERDQNGNTPGNWYSLDCDHANAAGGIDTQSKGWCGTIYANPITPAGAAVCGSAGVGGTNCAATSGPKSGKVGGANMADHNLFGLAEVQEIYIRWYRKFDPGYAWAGEKSLTINKCCAGDAGIVWGNTNFNAGSAAPSTASPAYMVSVPYEDRNYDLNPLAIITGHWYFMEMHIILNTSGVNGNPDGVLEFWMDDCGTDGLGCAGTPTLRVSYTSVNFGQGSTNGNGGVDRRAGIGSLWFENWANSGEQKCDALGVCTILQCDVLGVCTILKCDVLGGCTPSCGGFEPNCGSAGTSYYDQIKVSKVGPIGFM